MKIILDECLPQKLAAMISGHDVTTVPKMGWAGISNGKLLALIERDFEVFITGDRNLAFQQNLKNLKIAVIVLGTKSNRLNDLALLLPEIMTTLASITQGQVYPVGVVWIAKK